MSVSTTPSKPKSELNRTLTKAWNYRWIYLMLLPVMAFYIVYRYVPMYGVTIAFKNYNVFKGVMGSPWCGLDVFKKILTNKNFWLAIKNTLVLNFLTLLTSFPLTIIVSLMLNEIVSAGFKKVTLGAVPAPLYFLGGCGRHRHQPFLPAGRNGEQHTGGLRRFRRALPQRQQVVDFHLCRLQRLEGNRMGHHHLFGRPNRR